MKVSARLRGSGWVAWHMHDTRLSMPPPPLAASLAALAVSGGLWRPWRPLAASLPATAALRVALAASLFRGGLWRPRAYLAVQSSAAPGRTSAGLPSEGHNSQSVSQSVQFICPLSQISSVQSVGQSVSQFSLSATSV